MPVEIERKFLVEGRPWEEFSSECADLIQGYLNTDPRATIRVRIEADRSGMRSATLTIKGLSRGPSRSEYEYPVPVNDAEAMLREMAQHSLIKRRWFIRIAGHEWHVDEFLGDNTGLVTAEIEMSSENDAVDLPPWVGMEITNDHRYSNANLAMNPFTFW